MTKEGWKSPYSEAEAVFVGALESGRELDIVLMAHNYIGARLEALIRNVLPVQEKFKELERLRFGHKLALAEALGLLLQDHALPLRVLDELRNRFAHQLHAKISDADLAKLENAFQDPWQAGLLKSLPPNTSPLRRLQRALMVLAMAMDGRVDRTKSLRGEVRVLHLAVLRCYAADLSEDSPQ